MGRRSPSPRRRPTRDWPRTTRRGTSPRSVGSEEERADLLIDVFAIPSRGFELAEALDRLLAVDLRLLRDDVDERRLHVRRHALRVAADVDVRAGVDPRVE